VTLSRTQTTLLLNVFALIVAAAVAVAGSFILPERPEIFPGIFRPLAYSPYFVPAVCPVGFGLRRTDLTEHVIFEVILDQACSSSEIERCHFGCWVSTLF